VGQATELCWFRHVKTNGQVIGSFSKATMRWVNPQTLVLKGYAHCWKGGTKATTVTLHCHPSQSFLRAAYEVAPCQHVARFYTPAACP
jgi:hypothetical protein